MCAWHACDRSRCRKIKPDFLVNGAAVVSYKETSEGVSVEFQDGSAVDADVLVGSDGIWSAVRAQMYDEGEVKATSSDGLRRQG